MADNTLDTGAISVNQAVDSLLEALPMDKAVDGETVEVQASTPLETEAEATEEDILLEDSDEVVEDDVDESEDDDEYEYLEQEDEAPQIDVYTVKVDGEEHEVTFEELQKGYQTNRSLTKRGMELAEQRKAFEAEAQEVAKLRETYAQQLEQLSEQLKTATETEPDWAELSKQYSAEELFVYKAQLDQQKEYARQVEAEKQKVQEEQNKERQKAMQEYLAQQREDMLKRIPQWQDEQTLDKERQAVITYAQRRIGYSQEEIANASDARAIELLYKAWQWDKLQEKKPAVKRKVRKAPKMAKAGQPKTKAQVASRQRQQAMNRLNKERSVDAAVDLLMGR